MTNRHKTITSWMVVGVLAVGAFHAGKAIRGGSEKPLPKPMANMQASALLKLTPESAPITLDAAKQNASENRQLVDTVSRLIKAHYVDPVGKEKETEMARGAVRGMMESLEDPDCRFLDPTERKLLDDAGAGKFHGIGAILALKKEKKDDLDMTRLVIISPMPGSPAEAAGLKAGDAVTYVDGKWIISYDPFKEAKLEDLAKKVRNKETDELTYQKTYEAALKKLKDGVGILDALESVTSKTEGTVSLKVERAGAAKPIDVKLQCKNTAVAPVSAQAVSKGVAYIRVTQFSRSAPASFTALLSKAQSGKAKALVLDLRNCPGGLIDSATDIAGKITGGGVIANIQGNNGRSAVREPRAKKLGIPMVVLVNEGTASVAEMVAGTLKETMGATLVGTKTFGDGMVQTPLLLKDGSAAVLTTGKMLTAKGADFDGKGLSPDKQVKQTNSKTDTQREEAVKILLAKIGKA